MNRRVWFGAAIACALATGTFAFEGDASAFCRTTTCDKNTTNCREDKNGCTLDGVPLKWKEFPIQYRFHAAGSEKLTGDNLRVAVRNAFNAWETVQCGSRGKTSLSFQEGSDILRDKPIGQKEARDNYGIYFRDNEWPHNDTNESLALTNQVFGVKTGRIDYADIEVNTADWPFALTDAEDGIDLQAVLIHEVGHYIGLAHSNNKDAIMVARYCQDDKRCHTESTDRARGLSEDDILGVCTIYPPGGSGLPTAPATSGGCAAGSGTSAPAGDLALAGGVFALVAAVRRRGRKRAI